MDRDDRVLWFSREVLPHEGALRRWLGRQRRAFACDVDEVVQETYARLWSADLSRIIEPRPYLFVTARRVLGEIARRARIVSIETMADIEALNIVDDDGGAERALSSKEELDRLMTSVSKLPPKCRQVFELRKFHGLSQRETGRQLGIAESTVEKHLAKALQLILSEMTRSAASSSAIMDGSLLRHGAKGQQRKS